MTLELRDVVKQYPSGDEVVRAVDGVTLSVACGEMVALYGPSGSGKTTLLQIAAAMLKPDRGTVTFAGRDLLTLTKNEASDYRLRDVGMVMQDYELMRGVPAVDNACLKLLSGPMSLSEARKQAVPWLARVGLGHRLATPPERMSGGERQRVAIAQALTSKPRLILADEPTGSIDTQRGRSILELLRTISHDDGVATLLVTHDPVAAEVADRVLTLRDGRLEHSTPRASGSADDVAPIVGGP